MTKTNRKKLRKKPKAKTTSRRLRSTAKVVEADRSDSEYATATESCDEESTVRPDERGGGTEEFRVGREELRTTTGDRADYEPAAGPVASTSTWMYDDGAAACSGGGDEENETAYSSSPETTATGNDAAAATTVHMTADQVAGDDEQGPFLAFASAFEEFERVRHDGPASNTTVLGGPRPRPRVSGGGQRSRIGGTRRPSWSRKFWAKLFYDAHSCVVPHGMFTVGRPRRTGGRSSRDGASTSPSSPSPSSSSSWTTLADTDPPAFEVDTWRTADDTWSIRLQWTARDDGTAADGRSFEVFACRADRGDVGWRLLCRVDTRWPSVSLHADGFPAGFAYQLCVRRVGRRQPLGVVRTQVLGTLFYKRNDSN